MSTIGISIALSFLSAVIIGFIAGKRVKNSSLNFTVAGRSISALVLGLALTAQAVDGNVTLGNTSLSYDFGFWAGAALPIGLAVSLFFFGLFFAAPLNSLKLITMADLFEKKYNSQIGFIASLIMLLGFGVLLAGNIAAVGILLKLFFPISYESSVILSVLVILLYVLRGGIISDIYSDIFQMLTLVIGLILSFLFLIPQFGLPDPTTSNEIAQKFSLSQLYSVTDGGLINWATIIALGFGNLIAIDFASRIFSAKSPQAAKNGSFFAGFLTLILGIPFSLMIYYIFKSGLAATADTPILIAFSQNFLPQAAMIFLTMGIINASLSTIDGAMLSMGNILTRNLLKVKPELLKDPKSGDKNALYFFRISLFPIACAAMIFAFLLPSPGALISVAFDIAFAALLIPFVFAFFDKYAHPQAALYSIIFGGVSRVIFATLTPTLFGLDNPFYIQNTIIPPSWDGLATIVSPAIALTVYLLVLFFGRKYAPR